MPKTNSERSKLFREKRGNDEEIKRHNSERQKRFTEAQKNKDAYNEGCRDRMRKMRKKKKQEARAIQEAILRGAAE